MNKNLLIDNVAEVAGVSKKEAKIVVETVFDTIVKELVSGNEVRVHGFGTFKTKTRAARKGVNPSNGETIDIPESRTISFKASSTVKGALN